MILNMYYRVQGDRVHLRAFVLRGEDFEECGRFVLKANEFLDLVRVQMAVDYFDEEQVGCPPSKSQPSPN